MWWLHEFSSNKECKFLGNLKEIVVGYIRFFFLLLFFPFLYLTLLKYKARRPQLFMHQESIPTESYYLKFVFLQLSFNFKSIIFKYKLTFCIQLIFSYNQLYRINLSKYNKFFTFNFYPINLHSFFYITYNANVDSWTNIYAQELRPLILIKGCLNKFYIYNFFN
jgi:hypothetical protein